MNMDGLDHGWCKMCKMSASSSKFSTAATSFKHSIPPSRLGTSHDSLQSYFEAIRIPGKKCEEDLPTEFSLVVVLSPDLHPMQSDTYECGKKKNENNGTKRKNTNIRILLGKKLRGFGKGFYNCFGGKLETTQCGEDVQNEHDNPAVGAVRELKEETGIIVPLSTMEDGFVGTLNFTFDDWKVNRAMKVHLFCVFVIFPIGGNIINGDQDKTGCCDGKQNKNVNGNITVNHACSCVQKMQQIIAHELIPIDENQIRGCDEIEPEWFRDTCDIPLSKMFADDTLWLTLLLKYYSDDEYFQREFCSTAGRGTNSLHTRQKLMFDAWFHFCEGGAEINSIRHYCIQINDKNTTNNGSSLSASPTIEKTRPMLPLPSDTKAHNVNMPELESKNIENSSSKPGFTLERRLFHALHANHIHSPTIKEFKENWAFANSVRSFMKEDIRMEYVLDVAGGHGALGALFLLLVPKCKEAVVIDPAEVGGKKGVKEAWGRFWNAGVDSTSNSGHKQLRYRHECLRTGLRKELDRIFDQNQPQISSINILVVACHACQHLTDETLQIASEYGVNVAVMPCCQKDHDGWWKGLTKKLAKGGVGNIGVIMDLLAAGKMMAWETGARAGVHYRVKMKLMDEKISPFQNRMIICKAIASGSQLNANEKQRCDRKKDDARSVAHEKLIRAYKRAHKVTNSNSCESSNPPKSSIEANHSNPDDRKICTNSRLCVLNLFTGFCLGTAFSAILFLHKKSKR